VCGYICVGLCVCGCVCVAVCVCRTMSTNRDVKMSRYRVKRDIFIIKLRKEFPFL
jgi:hypothetical protein